MTITRDRIAADLKSAGIEPEDWVFLHSSLKSLGWVEGGTQTVIDAFLSVIGKEGLLIVPTLTPTTFHRKEKHKITLWNKNATPSRVGKITDTLWRMPDAIHD